MTVMDYLARVRVAIAKTSWRTPTRSSRTSRPASASSTARTSPGVFREITGKRPTRSLYSDATNSVSVSDVTIAAPL